MKKAISLLIISCFVTFTLAACAAEKNTSSALNHSKPPVEQKITSLSDLKTPDKIIYYINGTETDFTSSDAKFKQVISLNAQRDNGKLDGLEGVMTLDNIEQGPMLVYNYDDSGYEPVYFSLLSSDGTYDLAQPNKPNATMAQLYGFLSAPDKLLDFLNSH